MRFNIFFFYDYKIYDINIWDYLFVYLFVNILLIIIMFFKSFCKLKWNSYDMCMVCYWLDMIYEKILEVCKSLIFYIKFVVNFFYI